VNPSQGLTDLVAVALVAALTPLVIAVSLHRSARPQSSDAASGAATIRR
jgi:hypothetical protein